MKTINHSVMLGAVAAPVSSQTLESESQPLSEAARMRAEMMNKLKIKSEEHRVRIEIVKAQKQQDEERN